MGELFAVKASSSLLLGILIDDFKSLLDSFWDWGWGWKMFSFGLESLLVSDILQLDEFSFWSIVLVRSTKNKFFIQFKRVN